MSRFHKVLVALRGGPSDGELLTLAARLSHENGEIRAVHAIDIPRQGIFGDEILAVHNRMIASIGARLRREITTALAALDREGRQLGGVIAEGRPHVEILRAAETWNADLILVGGAKHRGLDATPIASESMTLVELSHRPVYVTASGELPERIVVPLNFGELSQRALDLGCELAKSWQVPLDLVHVTTGSWPLYPEYTPEEWWDTPYAGTGEGGAILSASRARLEALASAATERHGLSPEIHLIGGAVPGIAVADYVGRFERPLTIMGSLGRGLLRGAHLGDTARRYLRHSGRALLTFKTEAYRPKLLDRERDPEAFLEVFSVAD
ncbi:MAG: universal stress protein [Planctomycetes bacterium]|nr:universal stress protein [Planctomycetota bacterium]